MCNFFRRHIKDFSILAEPLTRLTHKFSRFSWQQEQQQAFDTLKTALTSAPILTIPDFKHPFVVATDASDLAVGGVLYQVMDDGSRRVVAYRSKLLSQTERAWATHERETFAIVDALTHWRHYLDGRHFVVETDHESLKYLQTQALLSKRQVHWLERLANFDFDVHYKPGKDNTVADCLSRPAGLSAMTVSSEPDWLNEVRESYQKDNFFPRMIDRPSLRAFVWKDRLLYLQLTGEGEQRLCIPTSKLQQLLLEEYHNTPFSAHRGRDATTALLCAKFFWPRMRKAIQQYVQSCQQCQLAKMPNRRTAGLLQPLSIPSLRWESVSMDFMTSLPTSARGNDSIMVVVDRLTKRAHFIPMKSTHTAAQVAQHFVKHVFKLHGVPKSIVSDRDPRFTSDFWRAFWTNLGTTLDMSSANHPQTDGQTERVNRVINEMLRAMVSDGRGWEEQLPLLEFAYNSAPSASTGMSPFMADLGFQPHTPATVAEEQSASTESWCQHLQTILATVRDNLVLAQQRQKSVVDQFRRPARFSPGDLVLVDAAYWGEINNRFSPRALGPFAVVTMIGDNAVQLELPPGNKHHSTVNIGSVRPFVRRDNTEMETTEQTSLDTVPPPEQPAETRPVRERRTPGWRHDYV